MAYAPLTKIPQQFFDNLGNPLVSGTLYAYLAGTSTPTNMFSDNAGTVAGTSVVLDSRGEPTTFKLIWLNTAVIYKFVLKDSTGTTIWTIDNISGDDGTGNTASSVFDQQTITATAGQTLFNLGYEYVTGTNAMAVYKNGSRLITGTDFTETSSTSVTLTMAAIAGDEYTFIGGQDVSSSFSSSNVSYTQGVTGAVIRSVQTKLRETVSVKDFGAVGDGVTDDTAAIQAAITYASTNGYTLFSPPGVYNHTGLTISKPLKWVGSSIRGPVYGVQTNFTGAVFQYTPTTGNALTITAASLLSNQGLAVEMESLVFEGNKNIVGASSGGGVNLVGDTAGETFFVSSSTFKNVHVRNAKDSAWTITGTCFLNSWYDCSGVYSGAYGLTHNKGSGNPTNNNWFGGYLSDNTLAGLNCNGGKMTLTATNISQNAGGGVIQDGGYLILENCDYEQNTGTSVAVTNSSGATFINGGMIHKTPATAAITGISFGTGCANNQVSGILFSNFDNASDRIIGFSGGGTLDLFDYRLQNVLSSAFPTSLWTSINRIPPKEKIRTGTTTFTGSGIRTSVSTITFSSAFEVSYTINVSIFNAAYDTTKTFVSIDADTQTLSTIRTRMISTDAGIGTVTISYIAIGR